MFNQTSITGYIDQTLDNVFKKVKNKHINLGIDIDSPGFFNTCHIYKSYILNTNQISKAIEKEKNLKTLYKNQKLNEKQVDSAIDKGKGYRWVLYEHQDLSDQNIDKALEEGDDLETLVSNHDLSRDQVDKVYRLLADWAPGKTKPSPIHKLLKNQELTNKQIHEVIKNTNGYGLYLIYSNQELSQKNIDLAISKGEFLDELKKHQDLTNKQLTILNL